MGIEALSKGAFFVTFIDKEKRFIDRLKNNLIDLDVNLNRYKLINLDILFILNNHFLHKDIYLKYDIVFIDPPFNKGLLEPTINLLIKFEWIKLGSLVYIEYEKNLPKLLIPSNWVLLKEKCKKKTIHKLFLIIK